MAPHYLAVLDEVIRQSRDCPALTDYSLLVEGNGNEYTYGGLYDRMSLLCKRFRDLGLNEGDHISICGVNSANWVVAYLAIAAYKAVSVTILHTQRPEMIARQVNFADSKAMFIDSDIWEALEDSYEISAGSVISLDDFSDLRDDGKGAQSPDAEYDIDLKSGNIDDLAQICYTSGSTNEPKGVMISFRNLSNNVECSVGMIPNCRREKIISVLPFAHIFGLVEEVLCQLHNAHHIYLMGRMMSAGMLSDAFHKIQPYMLFSVPAILNQIHLRAGGDMRHFLGGRIRHIISGGSNLSDELEMSIRESGLNLTVGYGTTETSPLISHSGIDEYKPYTVGKIVSGMEARISDEGEIMVRGENVMLGYYKNPEATRRKIGPDGWMHTGDRGFLDPDGNLHVNGRLEDDMIVLPSGENIHPQNIESLLNGIEGVTESVVLERNGSLVALVYSASNSRPSDILPLINGRLPFYSQLKDIEFVSEPFQKTGKGVIKRYLYR